MHHFLLLLWLSLLLIAQAQELVWRQINGITGDKKCNGLMCITATVNSSLVEYVLSSTGQKPVGWMGIGFGRQMAYSPMVIMWANDDGSITLSQRIATGHVMPIVDSNPARQASLVPALSSTSSSDTRFTFSIPANGDKKQFVVIGFGLANPQSAAVDADLEQHFGIGAFQLDLTKSVSPSPTGSTPTSASQPSEDDTMPLLPYQRLIVAHAFFCVVGFLLFLPSGVLVARYFRTATPTWFKGHWVMQFAVAGPSIIVGVALGALAVRKADTPHLNDAHKRLGVVIFVFYIFQCLFGMFVHWIKPKSSRSRPLQNFLHAILGLIIIGFALYQVWLGYKIEWPKTTGRGPLPRGWDAVFWLWVAILPLVYGAGLALLPKQYKQEQKARNPKARDYDED